MKKLTRMRKGVRRTAVSSSRCRCPLFPRVALTVTVAILIPCLTTCGDERRISRNLHYETVLTRVPAEAAIAICVTDARRGTDRIHNVFEWLYPAMETISSKTVSALAGNYVSSFAANFIQLTHTALEAPKQQMSDLVKAISADMLNEFEAAGMDIDRPQAFFALFPDETLREWRQVFATAAPANVLNTAEWVHCLPTTPGKRLDYPSIMTTLFGPVAAKLITPVIVQTDDYAFVFFSQSAADKYSGLVSGDHESTFLDRISKAHRRFGSEHDLTLYVSLPPRHSAAAPPSREKAPPRWSSAASLPADLSAETRLFMARELPDAVCLAYGVQISDEGLLLRMFGLIDPDSEMAKLVEEGRWYNRNIMPFLPRNSLFATQVNTEFLAACFGDELGITERVAKVAPDVFAVAVVAPSLADWVSYMALSSAEDNFAMSTMEHLPLGLVLVAPVDHKGQYYGLQAFFEQSLQSAWVTVADTEVTAEVTRTTIADSASNVRIDRTDLRWPDAQEEIQQQYFWMQMVNPLTIYSCYRSSLVQDYAIFCIGSGKEQMMDRTLTAMSGGWGLDDSVSFRNACSYVRDPPAFVVMGPLTKAVDSPFTKLAQQAIQQAAGQTEVPLDSQIKFEEAGCVLAVTEEAGRAEISLFVPSIQIRYAVKHATKSVLFGIGF
jgi:hypothetical protein